MWMRGLTDRLDLAIFGGPSIIRVKQDLASATETAEATARIEEQSKTTVKAGTVGADLTYRVTDRYGIGGFVRYAGGKVNLDAAPDFTVGGIQAAGGVRIRF
jgi:hypothetical protein